MSFREECQEVKELVLEPFVKPIVQASLLFQSGNILEVASESTLQRKSFPEPFDAASHIGNFREAAMVTVAAYAMIGIFAFTEKPREVFKRNVKKTAAAAFAVSSAVQVIGEKFELTNNLLQANTGDVLDAAYGIGWSGVVAVGACHLMGKFEQTLHDKEHEQDIASNPAAPQFEES